jgi:predicted aspartyl protease
MKNSWLPVAVMALSLVASLGRAQTPTGDDVHGQLAGNRSTPRPRLDFKLYRGYLIVVSGSVGGLRNLHFVVDTGTSSSIADRRLVEKLGVRQRPGSVLVPGQIVGQIVGAAPAVLTDVQVGPISAKSLPVLALDLSYLGRELGIHIDMLIGLDLLGQSSFTIDYEAKRIRFGSPPSLPLTLPMQSGPPRVTVPAQVNGERLRMLVITGSPAFMIQIANDPNGNPTIQNIDFGHAKVVMNIAGGQTVLRRVTVQSVRLGDAELGPQPAFLVDWKMFEGTLPIPGRFKEVAFDFEHKMLGLRR